MPVNDGVYPNFTIRFYDQNGDRLPMNDPDISVTLVFKKRELKDKIQEKSYYVR